LNRSFRRKLLPARLLSFLSSKIVAGPPAVVRLWQHGVHSFIINYLTFSFNGQNLVKVVL